MEAINHIEVSIPKHHVKPILRTLLYAVLFQRSFDTVEPATYELMDTHIATVPSSAIEKEITEKVDEFGKKYLDSRASSYGQGQGVDRGEIALIFTQKRSRKGWFGITEELVPWEAHFFTVYFDPSPRSSFSLSETLIQILTFCSERAQTVPPTSPDGDKLSHQILISPPPPSDLFAPSPPLPARSPPPITTTHHAHARDQATTPLGTAVEGVRGSTRRSSSPGYNWTTRERAGTDGREVKDGREGREGSGGALGYLEQAKDVLRATGARAGAVAGWTGRGRAG